MLSNFQAPPPQSLSDSEILSSKNDCFKQNFRQGNDKFSLFSLASSTDRMELITGKRNYSELVGW